MSTETPIGIGQTVSVSGHNGQVKIVSTEQGQSDVILIMDAVIAFSVAMQILQAAHTECINMAVIGE